MKKIILLSLMFAGVSFGASEKWTNKEGKTAELELVRVFDKDGEKAGEFRMRTGKTVILKASDLSGKSAEKLSAWGLPVPAVESQPSAFDEVLEGSLVKLQGKELKDFTLTERPKKYYVFYYTASWCGPCHEFTPSLVRFYKKNKNENFEIVLITSDRDEAAMAEYAAEKKMPWPQLKPEKAAAFKKEFQHGVTGIPSVIVCKVDGEKLGDYRDDLADLKKLVK